MTRAATVTPAMPRQPKKRAAILAVGLDKPTREIMITLFAQGILVSWVTVRKLQKEAGMVPIGSPRTPPGGGLVSARAAHEPTLPAFRTAAARLVIERGLAVTRAILEEVIADVEGN